MVAVKELSHSEGLLIRTPDFSPLISIAEVAKSNSLVSEFLFAYLQSLQIHTQKKKKNPTSVKKWYKWKKITLQPSKILLVLCLIKMEKGAMALLGHLSIVKFINILRIRHFLLLSLCVCVSVCVCICDAGYCNWLLLVQPERD